MRVKEFAKRWYLILFLVVGVAILGIGTTILFASDINSLISDINSFISKRIPSTAIVTRVIDGDTIEIEGGQRIRYIGIDTPEKGEYFFEEATVKNSELVLGKVVRMEKDVSETDVYGRLLRYIYVGDIFVNAELVRLGYAREAYYPPDTMHSDEFLRLEKYAVASDLGLHNEPEPTYVPIYRPKLFETEKPVEFRGFGTEEELQLSTEEVLEVSMAYSEYLQTLNAWEQAKIDYAAGTGTYGRCYITYQNMLQAKQKYERLKAGTGEFRGFESLRK